jgi:hypothetical protein
VVLFRSALEPRAVFPLAVLNKSAAAPIAVFSSALLNRSVPTPTAVLKLAVISLKSGNQPTAVFPAPLVRFFSAFVPSAVVKFGYPPSGGGLTAGVFGKTTMDVSVATAMIKVLEAYD